jgi:hypothetical protein
MSPGEATIPPMQTRIIKAGAGFGTLVIAVMMAMQIASSRIRYR